MYVLAPKPWGLIKKSTWAFGRKTKEKVGGGQWPGNQTKHGVTLDRDVQGGQWEEVTDWRKSVVAQMKRSRGYRQEAASGSKHKLCRWEGCGLNLQQNVRNREVCTLSQEYLAFTFSSIVKNISSPNNAQGRKKWV